MSDTPTLEALRQCRDALALASVICDRVPTRWHQCLTGTPEHDIGSLVNAQHDGSHGYRLIQDAIAAADAALRGSAEPPRLSMSMFASREDFNAALAAADAALSVPAGCQCEACKPNTLGNMRMILCSICGNKRCPHAADHRNACTNSNAPGQPGSSYPALPTPAALSVQAEPFAYWAQSDLGRVFSDGPGGMGLQWHPLYATPQPPAPVPAVPMSDEERASRHRAAFPWLE